MQMLFEFLPIILFFIAFKLKGIFVATAVAMAASAIQVIYTYVRHHKVDKMQVATFFIIMILGGATLVLHDETFVKWKPTAVNWVFALVFLASQFIGRKTMVQRMMEKAISVPDAIWTRLNLAWVAFFIVSGAANIYVAYNYSDNTWVNFKLFGLMGLTILFVIAQTIYLYPHMPKEAPPSEG